MDSVATVSARCTVYSGVSLSEWLDIEARSRPLSDLVELGIASEFYIRKHGCLQKEKGLEQSLPESTTSR